MLFEHMIDKQNLDLENDELDKDLICRLIKGEANDNDEDKKWMFEIVNN